MGRYEKLKRVNMIFEPVLPEKAQSEELAKRKQEVLDAALVKRQRRTCERRRRLPR